MMRKFIIALIVFVSCGVHAATRPTWTCDNNNGLEIGSYVVVLSNLKYGWVRTCLRLNGEDIYFIYTEQREHLRVKASDVMEAATYTKTKL